MIRTDILIIGAGISGLATALALRGAGFGDFLILEKADEIGGTWRENAYPGVACDIPSHLYALAGHPNPDWHRRYAGGAEIQAYLRNVARREGLYPMIRFGRRFAGADWEAAKRRWRVATAEGEIFDARVVIPAVGPLHVPRLPDLPGIETFAGPAFHSAEWNQELTLAGRNVAVIGAGASAAQFLPHLARIAGQVTLYQRSAPWVLPHFDMALPGWLRRLYRAAPALGRIDRALTFAAQEMKHAVFRGERVASALVTGIARAHMRLGLRDSALRRRLTPDYHIGCKRILLSNRWYPTLRRPNVEVVTGPVAEVRSDALVGSDGVVRPADVLICATGFRVTDRIAAMPFRGRGGRLLAEAWAGQAKTFLGSAVAGFPNLFFVLGPNTALGHNSVVLMAEAQAEHIVRVQAEMRGAGIEAVEPRPDRQTAHAEMVRDQLATSVWQTGGCTSWYKDAEGRNPTIWPGTVRQFRRLTRAAGLSDYRAVAS